jgi:hypothetical protein
MRPGARGRLWSIVCSTLGQPHWKSLRPGRTRGLSDGSTFAELLLETLVGRFGREVAM